MVATRPSLSFSSWRWPAPQLDRATALGLAIAGNALLFLMLSLPYSYPVERAVPSEPAEPPIWPDITKVSLQPEPELVPTMPEPPTRPLSQAVIRPIIDQPTSNQIELAPLAPTEPMLEAADTAPSVTSAQHGNPAGPVRERNAGVAYGESPPPPYPSVALRRGFEGTVTLRVLVSASGHVRSLQIESSSGHRELDRAAERQVMNHWKFVPALRDGRPVEAWARVPVNFSLRSR